MSYMSRDMEDQRERIRGRRRYELTDRNAETISRTQLHYARSRSQSSWRESHNWEDRETLVAHQRHQRRSRSREDRETSVAHQRHQRQSCSREDRDTLVAHQRHQRHQRHSPNREDRETSVAHQRHQRQLIEQQRRAITPARAREYGRARAVFRRVMNEMKKTVEIADGSADFSLLMVAAYGEGVMRSWEYVRAVFEDATGLQLKKETEDDEDDKDLL